MWLKLLCGEQTIWLTTNTGDIPEHAATHWLTFNP